MDVTRVGSMMKNRGILLGLEKRKDSLSPIAYSVAQIAADTQSPMMTDAASNPFCRFVSPVTPSSAILRDSTVGAPAVIVKSISSTDSVIWYSPTICAPREWDIHILNIKEASLVATEKTVTTRKD